MDTRIKYRLRGRTLRFLTKFKVIKIKLQPTGRPLKVKNNYFTIPQKYFKKGLNQFELTILVLATGEAIVTKLLIPHGKLKKLKTIITKNPSRQAFDKRLVKIFLPRRKGLSADVWLSWRDQVIFTRLVSWETLAEEILTKIYWDCPKKDIEAWAVYK